MVTHDIPLVAFKLEWHSGEWFNTWVCERYEQLTGLSTPVGQSVLSLPFNEADLSQVRAALESIRQRSRYDKRSVVSEWGYYTPKGTFRCKCVLHPVNFDENSYCMKAIGYFFVGDMITPSLSREVIARWMAGQAHDIQDLLFKYCRPQLQGQTLVLNFSCKSYAKAFECLRDLGRVVLHPVGVPKLEVLTSCPERLLVT